VIATLFTAHVTATLAMTGVLWFVQLVHYPLLGRVAPEGFAAFEREAVRRTTWVVGPLMLVEVGTGLALLLARPVWLPLSALWLDLGLIALNVAPTALVQVPLHTRLERGLDADAHRRLVRTNWLRTACWTLRAALLSWLVVVAATRA